MTKRQPAGIPAGGQFARGERDRADVELEQVATFPEGLPRYSQGYTPAQRQQVVDWFVAQPLRRLRRDQDLTNQQITLAYQLATGSSPPVYAQEVLLDLQTKASILTDAVMQQNFPETRPSATPTDAEHLAGKVDNVRHLPKPINPATRRAQGVAQDRHRANEARRIAQLERDEATQRGRDIEW